MRFGDDKAGYELTVHPTDSILRLEVWGLWPLAVGTQYVADMRACYAKLEGKPWGVLANIERFPPQSPEIAAIHGQLMGEASARGMRKAVSVVSSSMTKLQIKRLIDESGAPAVSFFTDEAAARASLLAK